MENRQSHLIERAAARLAEAQRARPAASPTNLDEAPRGGTALDMLDPQSSAVENAITAAGANGHAFQIDPICLGKAGLIREPDSRVAEEFRIVQNRVLRQSFGGNGAAASGVKNLVMITSALKGEGKSFVSTNLAGEIARHGDRRVLLVDADPKPSGLSRTFGLASARGVIDLARDPALDIASVVIATASEGLDALPIGQTDTRSGEVFASRRMGEVIERIGQRYPNRLVILDAPPCLSSSIPHALAAVCGQIVVVVAANSTQQADVEAALDLLQLCPHVSLLLNKVAPWMNHSFGSYSYLAAEA